MSNPNEEVMPQAWHAGQLPYTAGLTRERAKAMLAAAEEAEKLEDASMAFAICDAGGNLLAFERNEFAPLFTIEIATNKAYTAVYGKVPSMYWTKDFTSGILPTLPFHEKWAAFAGGFPLICEGKLLGGFGVSGGVLLNDLRVARAALAAGGFDTSDVDGILAMLQG